MTSATTTPYGISSGHISDNMTDSHSQSTLQHADSPRDSSKANSQDGIDRSQSAPYKHGDAEKADTTDIGTELGLANTQHEGDVMPAKFHSLGWKRLTICLIVEAIALGSLSIPAAFATLGMIAGVICCVGLGIVAIYTSYLVGEVKMKYPHVAHYADAVSLLGKGPKSRRFLYELTGVMFALFLILVTGSHTLTGTIAFINIVGENHLTCAVVFGVVSAILLFLVAIPPSFAEFAILGYIDFASIVLAIGITIIATGINAGKAVGGVASSGWSAYPAADTTLASGFLAVTNIVFAYSFAVCQYSFMNEMHTPKDYKKSIWALGLIEMFIYTFVGATVYAFVGPSVKSPALLSAGPIVARVAFGVAMPVIFISGSINTTVVSRYIIDRAFENSTIKKINDARGWSVWLGIIGGVTIIAWIIAQVIPFFNALLGLISSLFISGFTFYFPALFWFALLKEGSWKSRENIVLSIVNGIVLAIGIAVFVLGTYASVEDILSQYASGDTRSPFTCDASSYM